MFVINRKLHYWVCAALAGLLSFMQPSSLQAADPDNCLSCHRYRGLSRVADNGEDVRLFYVDPDYYDHSLGPHSRLRCTACHERSEVEVIPHKPVSPVNCTQTCHLSQPGQVEKIFSHESVDAMLADSVHTEKILSASNDLLGEPLAEGQSQCLLCHDEPKFRWPEETWAAHSTPIGRCENCHDEQLMLNTRLAYWHVYARTRRARPPEDQVRVCGMCHSNTQIREEFDLSHATASYLASFHGKAMLLGDHTTAVCLDCHAAETANVHHMLSHENPVSPVHIDHLSETCRSTDCHPAAGQAISDAAVHLDLATTRGIEFFIGAIFVVLILSTFGPSAILQSLELLHIVIGRHDPRVHAREQLAERMMANPEARQRLKRFNPHQRFQHWLLFATFTALCLTGFPIKFADRAWAQWLIEAMGGLSAARQIHRWAGVILMLGFVYHLIYAAVTAVQNKMRTNKSWLQVTMELPMMATPKDIKYLFHQVGYLLFICKTRPDGDRFTLKEKFEYFGVFWGSALLGLTGILMWFNAWTTEVLTGRVLTIALLLHTFEAFLALLHVGIIHMVGVIFAPAVFPLSPAMFTGDTPAEEMAEAHAGMLNDVAGQLGIPTAEGGRHE